MSITVRSGGSWRTATAVHVKNNGSWKPAKEVWVKSGGTWRKGWSARTVTIFVQSSEQVRTNWGQWNEQQYDRITFGISVNPYLAPSSYSWGNEVSGTASTAVFTGPTYNTNGFMYQSFGNAYCSVVIGGQTYELSLDFQYTSGDQI
ncbi:MULTISPECIES: hypothetical protein [Brevundimonas]|uniref:hypothetical protein n=1 Tax=Brevundimonas TaxID=41275 RepID=UPI0010F61D6C|nr:MULTISPECIES: hypothetical protein [Brevundimonas]